MKKCSDCKQEKELKEFHKNVCVKGGYQNCCKICMKERLKKWYDKNTHKRSEYMAKQREKNRQENRAM